MTLQQLNNKFRYKTDKEQYGISEYWEELKTSPDGYMYGDCETYSITLKRRVDGFQNWKYWYCKLNDGGHCVLVSPDGSTVIDNNIQKPIMPIEYIDMYTITNFRKYKWYELLWKFGSAKVIGLWFKYISKMTERV